MHVLRSAMVLAALSPAVLAADIHKPSGLNVETLGSVQSVAVTLNDGTKLIIGGSFGSQSLLALHPNGTTTPWAVGFQFFSGLAVSPVTGDLVAGDSGSPPRLVVLRDLNGDGDALDAGENVLHPAQPPVLPNGFQAVPFSLAFRDGTDELYMTASTFSSPSTGVVTRTLGGAVAVYADGFVFPGTMIFEGDALFVNDSDFFASTGRIVALRDLDDDGDALDAGENTLFAGGFTGASGMVRRADGTFLLATGNDGLVARCAPDGNGDGTSDDIEPAWLGGFGFAGSLTLHEGPAGFVPGSAGDGELRVSDFTVGTVAVRSAPLAESTVTGLVANDSAFDILVTGAPGAHASVLLSLDPMGITVPGIGDLLGGFSAPFLLLPLGDLDVDGEAGTTIIFHGLPGLVGLPLAVQGVVLEGGRFGLAQGASFLIG